MTVIQERPAMLQKAFEGTEQEFERYRKNRHISTKKRFIVVYEDDQKEENILPDEQLEESHILHPSNRKWLIDKLEQSDNDIKEGRTYEATPDFFDDIKKRGRERLLKVQG